MTVPINAPSMGHTYTYLDQSPSSILSTGPQWPAEEYLEGVSAFVGIFLEQARSKALQSSVVAP